MNLDDFPFNKLMAEVTKKDKVATLRMLEKVRLHILRLHDHDLKQNNKMIAEIAEIMSVYWNLGVLEEDIREKFCSVRRSLGSEHTNVWWVVGDGDQDGEYADYQMDIDGLVG